ncbi:MAG: C25 family cysteine peptidase, partial [Bacteroidota bacterium]
GRIPASEPYQIKDYLDKVMEYEMEPDYSDWENRLWKKNIIHLNGGANTSEITTIKSYMDLMAFNISNNKYSGATTSFNKERVDAATESQSAKLERLINEGVGLVTFFGHSAATSFDYSINSPEDLENEGRYFIMNAMGCNSGQIHSGVFSLSERFVLAPDRGAIAFMASSGLGYISAYRTFGLDHYNKLGDELYGETLGNILLSNLKVLDRSFQTHQLLAQQMTLNGDPAIKVNNETGPDYVIDESTVEITPGNLNAGMSDYEINFSMLNLGGGPLDSIFVRIEQELPDGSMMLVSESKERTPKYYEPLNKTIQGQGLSMQGWNRFHISIDVYNDIDETPNPLGEENNVYIHTDGLPGYPVYVNSVGVKLNHPSNFGIVGKDNVSLNAEVSPNVLEEDLFVIEFDTTELFNSPFKISDMIPANGTELDWDPGVTLNEDEVYYWRISPDSTGQNGFVWENENGIGI